MDILVPLILLLAFFFLGYWLGWRSKKLDIERLVRLEHWYMHFEKERLHVEQPIIFKYADGCEHKCTVKK
jgi:hypothetical protein